MQRVGKRAVLALAVLLSLNLATSSPASTIATFADPSIGSQTLPLPPLFTINEDNNTVSASYSSLLLKAWNDVIYDVRLSMEPVTIEGRSFDTGPGSVKFLQGEVVILQIDFNRGHLNDPFSFGATEFITVGDDVTFSGQALLPFIGVQDGTGSFAFSFANQTTTTEPNGYTATAAFTSSGQLVPEPSSLAGLAGLALLAARRRRR